MLSFITRLTSLHTVDALGFVLLTFNPYALCACCVQVAEKAKSIQPRTKANLHVSGQAVSCAGQPQVLASALEHLSHLQPHISELVLTHFTMSNALAEVLTAAVTAEQGWGGVRLSLAEVVWPASMARALKAPLPALHTLSIRRYGRDIALTDAMLAQLQRSGTTVNELRITDEGDMRLKSPVPPGTLLPFKKIRHRTDAGIALPYVLHHASLLGPGVPWENLVVDICLKRKQVRPCTSPDMHSMRTCTRA